MPFNIQIIDSRDNERSLLIVAGEVAVFETGADAATQARERREQSRESAPYLSYRVLKIENTDESDDWKKREKERFVNGQYLPIPWEAEAWFKDCEKTIDHFPHMSKDKTGMIAYTESPDRGRDDVQKRIRPGRYLNQFFRYTLSGDQIRYWAGKVSILSGESQAYKLAKTPDEIERVYVDGPNSCMGHDSDNYRSREHPTRVYGAGDLAIAYIEREDSIAARVLVWPDKKIWGRVYGDGGIFQNQLVDLLDQDGYQSGACPERWKGAKLLRIENCGGFVVPYLDIGGGCVTDKGDYLEISHHGEIDGQSETGITGPRDVCESCSENYNAEDEGGAIGDYSYCQSCYEEYAVHCEDCGATVHRDYSTYLENVSRQVCDSCAEDYPVCDSCCEQFRASNMNHVPATGEDVCDSCYSDNYGNCADCGEPDKPESLTTDNSGDTLCESCHETRVESGETTSTRVESENQTELTLS